MNELVDYYYDIFNNTYDDKKKKKRTRIKKIKRQFIIGKNTYVSAGIIFYRIKNNMLQYLLIERNDNSRFKYEDLGGKISDEDENIADIAAREAAEESNAAFVTRNLAVINTDKELYVEAINKSIDCIKGIIEKHHIQPHFFPEIKYAIYMIPYPEVNSKISYEFGDHEIVHDPSINNPVKRTISWHSEYELKKIDIKKFNPRIRILMNSLFRN
jgi:hypothetical protein